MYVGRVQSGKSIVSSLISKKLGDGLAFTRLVETVLSSRTVSLSPTVDISYAEL
ncbi:hypothetical protein [Bacillus sp. JCM 19041]|uniref:hypothetical protein n=1 Tax=Bacillus sp. JCM 19041 TaxID=1460637 RepID=UPI0018D1D247